MFSQMDGFNLETDSEADMHFELESEELTDEIFPRTDPMIIGHAYQILKVFDKEINRLGIPYWCAYGTILGAVRHGGIIPWDDDIDVCVMLKDRGKLYSLCHLFKRYGLELVQYTDWLWKLRPKDTKYPFVDIFFVVPAVKNGKNIVRGYRVFEYMHWYNDEIKSLNRIQFGPIQTNIAASSANLRFIYSLYGLDCLTHAVYRSLHHNGDDEIHRIKVKIVNFEPAEYVDDSLFIPLND